MWNIDKDICKVGDEVWYRGDDFDGHFQFRGTITEKHPDHMIVNADGMNLMWDKDTDHLFIRVLFKYGMRLRGYSPGCQPKEGLVAVHEDTSGKYYNTLLYNRKLTEKEVRDYEFDELGVM